MKGFISNSDLPIPRFKDLFEAIDELSIFSYYIPDLVLNRSISSPIGEPDSKPSFDVFWSTRYSKYLFKEHRYGYSGNCVDFVRHYFGYTNNTRAVMRIMKDFSISGFKIDSDIQNSNKTFNHSTKVTPKKKKSSVIEVTVREWEKHDLEYWNKYGIDKQWLAYGDIYPIKFFFINKIINVANKYSYAYLERKDDKITFKIYQPFSRYLKWISNNNMSVWELWNKLPETGDLLIITKSRKDALSIMATSKIPATSLQAEGTIPKIQVIDELKSRFKHIFLFYDNDYNSSKNWGQEYSNKLSEMFDIPGIYIPDVYESKDYTDFIVKYSIKEAKELIWFLIKKQLINDNRREKTT